MLRFLLRTILFFVFIFLAIGAGLYFMPKEYYKQAISWVAFLKTRSDLQINGDLVLSPSGEEILILNDVALVNSPTENAKVSANFSRISILRSGLELTKINIGTSKIDYFDAAANNRYQIKDLVSDISLPAQGKPMQVSGNLNYNEKKVDYKITIDDPSKINSRNGTAVATAISTDFLYFDHKGKISSESNKGQINLNINSIEQVIAWIGSGAKISGAGVIDLNFDLTGNNIAKLNGNGSINFINLVQGYTDEKINKLVSHITKNNMEIKKLTGTFEIKNGVIYNEDLKGDGPTVFSGKGSINLVEKKIDYKITPDVKITSVQGIPNITPPVTIKGSFSNPEVSIEVQYIIKEVIGKPEQVIKTITDLTTNNADGKQLKKDLQDLRDNIIKDPGIQEQVLDGLLGGDAGNLIPQIIQGTKEEKAKESEDEKKQQDVISVPDGAPSQQ